MRIGIFDSGLGGLIITRAIMTALPQHDLVYLGDTARVPYGNRSPQTVHEFLRQAVDFLFAKNCALIVVACNTASAEALRRIQKKYLPKKYPDRRVLGVIIPTAEVAAPLARRVAVLATSGTVASHAFVRELRKISPRLKIKQQAAPLLVPLIENSVTTLAMPFLRQYLAPLKKFRPDTLILGCTHYPLLKKQLQRLLTKKIRLLAQDEIIPQKLKEYLKRHPEIERKITRRSQHEFLLTDITPTAQQLARRWLGKNIRLRRVVLK